MPAPQFFPATEWHLAYENGRTRSVLVPVFCGRAGGCDCIKPGQWCGQHRLVEVPE